jgi:hypothetical protein
MAAAQNPSAGPDGEIIINPLSEKIRQSPSQLIAACSLWALGLYGE